MEEAPGCAPRGVLVGTTLPGGRALGGRRRLRPRRSDGGGEVALGPRPGPRRKRPRRRRRQRGQRRGVVEKRVALLARPGCKCGSGGHHGPRRLRLLPCDRPALRIHRRRLRCRWPLRGPLRRFLRLVRRLPGPGPRILVQFLQEVRREALGVHVPKSTYAIQLVVRGRRPLIGLPDAQPTAHLQRLAAADAMPDQLVRRRPIERCQACLLELLQLSVRPRLRKPWRS
mmetsp:Transcript_77532/g.209521  ORF Transcript_77532/g.209521 Transcript_77532/m.209521 type:complete len:228 (-) Transcript_77532:603-1286(-)